jgi:putative SOS response-associated peptidase YedK
MCGRYRLRRHWEQDLLGKWRYVIEKVDLDEERLDVRPTDLMPVIRSEDFRPVMELRRWGFLRVVPGTPNPATGQPGKLVRKQLFNAKSETAAVLPSFRDAFSRRRCLVPMSSWYEWPTLPAGKQRVEIARLDRRTMFAAGLYETSAHFATGEPVPTFVVLTTKPNEFLGTVHDRSPLILDPRDYEQWLFGDTAQAQALCGVLPNSADYDAVQAAELPAVAASAAQPTLF